MSHDALKSLLGPGGYLEDDADVERYLTEWRGRYRGSTPLVLRPASTAEVAAAVGWCAQTGTALVPQGGNTGLCGGAVPDESGREVVLSLERMNRIRSVDPLNDSMTVEAGCVLADLQRAADEHDRLFPLSLSAEGSCQIGGNLSTDAGGVNVLRYGTARGLVLGLEVVLPDGRVWDGLRGLRKDTAGYDLKQLFVGAEGTLGIITAATLRLFPRPAETATAMAAVADPAAAVELLARLRGRLGETVSAFELIPRRALEYVLAHISATADPFDEAHPWYVLMDVGSGSAGARELLEAALGEALEAGALDNAVVAANEQQREALWRLRHSISEAQKHEGASIKHDVAVPVASIPEFLRRADAAVAALVPEVRVVSFGHLGDGNLHYNLSRPEHMENDAFQALAGELNRAVYDLVTELGGTISAEHGIGRLRRADLERYRGAVDLDLMRRIKRALDPQGIMNPGKVV